MFVFVSVSVSAFFFFAAVISNFVSEPGPRRVERAVQDGVEGERLLAALERRLSRRLGLGLRARRFAPGGPRASPRSSSLSGWSDLSNA